LESIVPVHPTAVRRPNYITVQSENTVYTDDHITAKYLNRGADVVVSDGQFTILPTVKPYEFQTARKVGKTGFVIYRFRNVLPSDMDVQQTYDDRFGW
jgi:myo-inositol-1-phosphate synthase